MKEINIYAVTTGMPIIICHIYNQRGYIAEEQWLLPWIWWEL
jgi:hypothetical protein